MTLPSSGESANSRSLAPPLSGSYSRGTESSNPSPSSGESCKPIILVQLGDSRLRAVISSGKAQHLDAQVGILGNQLAVCDRDAPHSLIVGGGSPVPGGRMARGQQPRPGEQ